MLTLRTYLFIGLYLLKLLILSAFNHLLLVKFPLAYFCFSNSFFIIIIILFKSWVICQNKKRSDFHTLTETRFINNARFKQNKKSPEHPFINIGKLKKCEKFQEKILNSVVAGAPQSFQFFRQITWFLGNNRVLSQFKWWLLHYLITVIISKNN